MSGVRINYLPSACEHIQSLTDRGSTAQGAPLHEDRMDSIPTVPHRIPPASRAEPTSPKVPTAPVFRRQPPQPQTPLVERPQPTRADRGATRQADMTELLDHVSQEMTKLYPLIVDLHTDSASAHARLSGASAHTRLVRTCCGHGSRVRVRSVQQI